ncbi:hypothetical protein WJX84_001647 [Apatococcus fuscideae]|uniref:F-box domain-containing protein n=1 Tax=Apatococcus fuscideae TaxID=2026836 RepID=A0AAW1SMT5_9CHLO
MLPELRLPLQELVLPQLAAPPMQALRCSCRAWQETVDTAALSNLRLALSSVLPLQLAELQSTTAASAASIGHPAAHLLAAST